MARSFGLVEGKLEETIFFLEEIEKVEFNLFEARCYFNAFVSSARSVTFALQSSLNDVQGFDDWYEEEQAALKTNRLARFFVECRNDSQKIGLTQITAGYTHDGRFVMLFGQPEFARHKWLPDEDVVTCCKKHLSILCSMIQRCLVDFGPFVDPDQFYTVENLRKIGWSIEDVEEELGFPRGYTDIQGQASSEDDRLEALRKHIPKSNIKATISQYILPS